MWAAGYDIHTQRKGLLILAWFDKASKISNTNKKQVAKDHEVATVRACAIHMCTPDTPLYRFRQSVATMRIGHNRKKLKTHLGTCVCTLFVVLSFLPSFLQLYFFAFLYLIQYLFLLHHYCIVPLCR